MIYNHDLIKMSSSRYGVDRGFFFCISFFLLFSKHLVQSIVKLTDKSTVPIAIHLTKMIVKRFLKRDHVFNKNKNQFKINVLITIWKMRTKHAKKKKMYWHFRITKKKKKTLFYVQNLEFQIILNFASLHINRKMIVTRSICWLQSSRLMIHRNRLICNV